MFALPIGKILTDTYTLRDKQTHKHLHYNYLTMMIRYLITILLHGGTCRSVIYVAPFTTLHIDLDSDRSQLTAVKQVARL